MKPPELFGIPFTLTSDPEDDLQRWELELFTCMFLIFYNPGISERVAITRDTHLMHRCNSLEEATEFLTAQLQPSLMLVISKVRNS